MASPNRPDAFPPGSWDRPLWAVLDQLPVGVAIAEIPTGRLLFHNARAVELLGHPLIESADHQGYVRYGARHPDGTPYQAEEYPIARAVLTGEAIDRQPMLYLRGDGALAQFEVSAARIHDEDGRPLYAVSTFEDVGRRARAEAALEESEARFHAMADLVPDLLWRNGPDGRAIWFNRRWLEFTGLSQEQAAGDGWRRAIHPADREMTLARLGDALPRGQPIELQHRMCRHDGENRWFLVRAEPVRDYGGAIVQWLGAATDIDDLRRMQDEQSVLVAELQHRTRNLLAVVQSIAHQTMALSDTPADFTDRFTDRLAALSRVQRLLSASDESPVTLRGLVDLELDALGAEAAGTRIRTEGPHVPLRKTAVQTLSLALHELATNARKYGALTDPEGSLSITWRCERNAKGGDPRVELRWIERSPNRRPAQPPRLGYGRQLIERALPHSLGAQTHFVLTSAGLDCRIDLPLHRRGEEEIAG